MSVRFGSVALAPPVDVAFYLVVRASELDALEGSDFEIDRQIVNVRRALDRSRANQAKSTKTGDARRFRIEAESMPLLCETKDEAGGQGASGQIFPELDHTSYSQRLGTFLF